MHCPACQTENRPGIRFCEQCGATLEAACPACGASVPAEARFCGACGAPRAHEDHARRAAHGALGMQRALERYRDELARARGIDFRVRMGLNTGLVVVGAIGDNLRMDYTAVGDTTNTAARMQQLAQPGQIVLAEPTERLVRGYVQTRALGAIPAKGKSQPVAAYELLEVREGIPRRQ